MSIFKKEAPGIAAPQLGSKKNPISFRVESEAGVISWGLAGLAFGFCVSIGRQMAEEFLAKRKAAQQRRDAPARDWRAPR